MEKDKNSKYWGYMDLNEAVRDKIQPDIGVGKEIILLIYEHNVSQSLCLNVRGLANNNKRRETLLLLKQKKYSFTCYKTLKYQNNMWTPYIDSF